jgi:mono/diheme cytochrome c family protein
MRDVVHASLSHLNDHDLEAMATYLLNASEAEPAVGQKESSEPSVPPEKASQRGSKLYSDNCAKCHKPNGDGIANVVPPLAGNPVVIAKSPTDIISVVLKGVPPRGHMAGMPSFAGSLSDQDIADLTNYVRTNWGNRAAADATSELVAAWRTSLTLPAYAGYSARGLLCPTVGSVADQDKDLIAALGAKMQDRAVDYARLVDMYKDQRPKANMAQTVDVLVAAYCPAVAASDESDQAKAAALKHFAINVAAYIMRRQGSESMPNVDIVWATSAGYTLAEHLPTSKAAHACPPNDGSLVPETLVDQAQQLIGKPDLAFRGEEAATQANSLATKNATAKLANVANALILAFCRGTEAVSGVDLAQKQAALSRYGDEVIGALQTRAETNAQPVVVPQNGK